MAQAASDFRLNTTLDFRDVEWSSVIERLITRVHLTPAQAKQLTSKFFERFLTPLEPFWFKHNILSPEYNRLIAAICEVHGADSVTLEKDSRINFGPVAISHSLRCRFIPTLKSFDEKASVLSCIPHISLKVFGSSFEIESVRQVILWRLLAMLCAIALAVPFMGCLLYALFVFVLFIDKPEEITITALNHGPIGLALLCFLVGCAGLFGRAAKNTYGKLREMIGR